MSDWDAVAERYNTYFVPQFAPLYTSIMARIPKTDKELRVLGFGSGSGEPDLTIARTFSNCHITVTDPSAQMIEIAKKRFSDAGVTADFVVDPDLAAIGTFDVIIASLSLMFVEADKRGNVVDALSKCLKAGGTLITAHWAHPESVPTLRVIIGTKMMMETGSLDLDAMGTSI
jgi:tRNA (cmo5U34)-methyltransferase